MGSKFSKLVSSYDSYSTGPNINFNGAASLKTIPGGLVSIFFKVAIAIFVLGHCLSFITGEEFSMTM